MATKGPYGGKVTASETSAPATLAAATSPLVSASLLVSEVKIFLVSGTPSIVLFDASGVGGGVPYAAPAEGSELVLKAPEERPDNVLRGVSDGDQSNQKLDLANIATFSAGGADVVGFIYIF